MPASCQQGLSACSQEEWASGHRMKSVPPEPQARLSEDGWWRSELTDTLGAWQSDRRQRVERKAGGDALGTFARSAGSKLHMQLDWAVIAARFMELSQSGSGPKAQLCVGEKVQGAKHLVMPGWPSESPNWSVAMTVCSRGWSGC
jgi:hypothetical protein